ncbi:MAG: RNB domain-containing ribonuclease [Opitutae bacterium]|nr:RNB domain-containing ribonuclease [Opitutae bacterium]
MKFRKAILDLLGSKRYIPLRAHGIGSALGITKNSQQQTLNRELGQLLAQGQIVKIKKGRFVIPRDADLVSGTIRFRQSGNAVLLADPFPDGTRSDPLPIRAADTATALHQDKVVARRVKRQRRLYGRGRHGHRLSKRHDTFGRVIRILERKNQQIVGTLKKARYHYYIVPDNPSIHVDVVALAPEKSGLHPLPKTGDKVVVEMEEWNHRHMNPEGKIVEVLGKTFTPGAEYRGVLRKFGLEPQFPPAVLKETGQLPDSIPGKALAGRRDLTKVLTFTIDPDDAKDFDDALSVEYLGNGNIRIGIHIADVAAFVKPGSALDREALRRGNSTYLVGTVIPMLPEGLSNGLCSLQENVIRLTKSVIFTFSPEGKIRKVDYANTFIKSRKRLTYGQAMALLKEDDLDVVRKLPLPSKHQTASTGRPLRHLSDGELAELQRGIRNCWSIASILRQKRFARGSLDLNMPEVKIYVDENGYASEMKAVESDESHHLIEEFMLAANEAVARQLRKHNIPAIYRVHQKPDEQKLFELRETMLTYGLQTGDLNSKREVVKLLEAIKSHICGYTLRIQFLRALRQACYLAKPEGHYGLHKANYTHFTSPIRRYSDLVVHRIFDNFLVQVKNRKPLPGKRTSYKLSRLEEIAQQVSSTERNSTDAERESVKIKQLEYFERELKKPEKTVYNAAILEIKNHGLFVELKESLVFGLLPMSRLKDDLYRVSEDGNRLNGRRTGKTMREGETIQVVVAKVDRFKRQIDFDLANPAKLQKPVAR